MISFQDFVLESRANDTQKTQVATTEGTYRKTGEFLKPKLGENSRVINVGAGLDQTKRGLQSGLGHGHVVHDMEPNPEKRKTPPEFTAAHEIPNNHYHAAVCHNVLNVVEPEVRHQVVRTIFDSLRQGGHAVIGTRKWTGDISKTKNFEHGEEPKSVWVNKNGAYSYQKGFDGDELKDYIEGEARKYGHEVEVKKVNGIAANAVHVRMIKKGS